jgi:hypothetical protein
LEWFPRLLCSLLEPDCIVSCKFMHGFDDEQVLEVLANDLQDALIRASVNWGLAVVFHELSSAHVMPLRAEYIRQLYSRVPIGEVYISNLPSLSSGLIVRAAR